jgi:hypothetical protein
VRDGPARVVSGAVLQLALSILALSTPADAARLDAWGYRADPADVGLRQGWQGRRMTMAPVVLPHVPNARAVRGSAGRRGQGGAVGWWRTDLVASSSGEHMLRFASVHHRATVWLDGRRICAHVGAYEPFRCPATLRAGTRHEVTVRADWRKPAAQRRAGYDRAWFNWGGMDGPVTVESPAATRLDLVGVRTRLAGGNAHVTFVVRVRDYERRARVVRVAGGLRRGGREVPVRFAGVRVPAGGSVRVSRTVTVRSPRLWAPGRPALHELSLAEPGGGELHQLVGLRELTWPGGRLRLNGRLLRLQGAGLPPDARGHGDGLTGADHERIVTELRAIGANAARAQYPLSDDLLERLDRAGILVWQLVGPFDKAGAFRSGAPRLRAAGRRKALATVERQAAHPSVVAWSLANEAAGQGHPAGQAAYIDAMARELHRIDPGRLVAADLWGPHLPRRAGLLHRNLDAVGFTEYVGLVERAGRSVAEQDALVRSWVASLRRLFPGKVAVVTEFGANANARNRPERPGGYAFQARLIASRIALYRSTPLSGTLVWTLRDYAVAPDFTAAAVRRANPGIRLTPGLSEKGLFGYDGRAKPAVRAVRRAFARER